MAYVTRTDANPGDLGSSADQNQAIDNEEALKTATAMRQVTVILDGGASPLVAGARCGFPWKLGAWTITAWELDEVTDIAATTVIDVWRLNAGIPVVANSIVGGGGTHPTLAAADRGASAPAGWTSVAIANNDVLVIYVESNDLAEKLAVTLYGTMAV